MTKKTKGNKPPKRRGAIIPPLFKSQEGQPRTCETCGETKPISFRTFAPRNASPDGISPTCRSCQGRRATATPPKSKSGAAAVVDAPSGWPKPSDRKRYWGKVEETITELYALGNQKGKAKQLAAVCASLNKVTRLVGDPAGGGEQTEPELAFRTFAVLSRLISNWTGWGEIHDNDIIAALLDPADQVLLLASRNSGKSTVTEMYAAWLLHRNPLDIIGVVSGSTRRAKRTLRTVRLFIDQCPLLRHLAPDDACLDAADQFVTPAANGRLGASVSFSSFGIASNMTGMRWNKVILDDVETKDARSVVMQETLDLLTSEIHNVLNPGGRVVALGTPQVAGRSIYARWAASEDWRLYRAMLFEELPPDEGRGTRPQLRSRWPQRWTDEALEKKRRTLPEREWDLHWRISLEALDEDDRPLKLRDFITTKWEPSSPTFPTIVRAGGPRLEHLETGAADADDFFAGPAEVSEETTRYVVTCAAVDPASGMQGRDEAGVAVVSVTTQGVAVVRCIAGVRGRSAQETLTRVASLIHSFHPTKIICEARADSLYPAQLSSVLGRRGYPALVEPVQSGARKGERIIDALGVPLSDARLVLLESVVSGTDAMETIKQIANVTADARNLRHDDRVDALAWAVAAVGSMLTVDESESLETASRHRMDDLLRLPLRRGGITEGGLEARSLEMSEAEERLRMKLDNALAIQEEELRRGDVDQRFAAYIEALQRDLAAFRRHQTIN